MKRRTLRALACSLVAALVVACGLALGGCSGTSAEDAIRQDLTSTLDEAKNLDDETIQELMDSLDTAQLETYGIDGTELVRSLLDGFDYTINSITVDGDTAAASVSITCKSATDLYNELGSVIDELSSDADFMTLLTDEDALNARIGELVMEAMNSLEPSTKDLELTYTQTNGEWTMDSSSSAALSQVFASSSSQPVDTEQGQPTATESVEADGEGDGAETSGATLSQQNALESAQSYLSFSHFSYNGLIGQLEYEGYPTEDATWAVDNCGADWNEQAAKSAQQYLDFSSFSRDELIGQLEYEGFTHEQAVYGVDAVGL